MALQVAPWCEVVCGPRLARRTCHNFLGRVSVLVLRLPDQSERVVTYCPEYGDGDGRQRVGELMQEMTPMLRPGEVLHVTERVVR